MKHPRPSLRRLPTAFAVALVASTLGGSAPAHAQGEPLSLTDAIRRALDGNVDLRKERITIAIADANLLAANGQFDVILSSGAQLSRTTTPPVNAADISGGYNNTLGLNLGLSRALETGGNVALTVNGSRVNTNTRIGSCASGDCTYYANTWTLAFTHPLLRNFGTEIAQANVRRQTVLKDLALLNRQTRAATVVRDVITTYWELAYSTQDLNIRRAAVDLAREQLRLTQAQIDVGRLSPVDSAAVERAINDRLQEVALSEQSLLFASLSLRRLFGLKVDPTQPAFGATDAPTDTPAMGNGAAELQRALEGNPQLRSLRQGLALNAIDVQTAQSLLKPRLDFTGQVGTTGRDVTVGNTIDGAGSFNNLVTLAGLTFQMPLQNRVARGQLEATRLTAEGATLDVDIMEQSIRDAVSRTVSNWQTATRRLEYARAAIGFAQKNLEAEQARFSVGRTTNNDVLLRQQELKVNQLQVVRATVDLLQAETALAALTGELLERYGLALKGQ